MAINKNFVVKNGLEVNTQLIYADADTNNVGIASTQPRIELDVRGGIAATNVNVSGVSTIGEEFRVGAGIAGTVFTVLGIDNLVGVGTSQPAYILDVRAPVSTGQTALYVQGDVRVTGDINLDDVNLDNAQIASLVVSGISTYSGNLDINADIDVSQKSRLNELEVSGLSTFSSNLDINADVDIDRSLTITGGTRVTGLSTFNSNVDVNADLDVNRSLIVSAGASISGLSTFNSNVDVNADLDINRSLTVTGGTRVTGLTTFNSNVDVNADLDVNRSLIVSVGASITGLSTFNSNVDINADVDINRSLTITGGTRVTGLSTFNSNVDVNADLDVNRSLIVSAGASITGLSTFNSNVDINADVDINRSLAVTGGSRVTGVSTFTGLVDVNGGVDVTGLSTFSSNLDINADVDINRSLIVSAGASITGLSTFNSNVDINADVDVNRSVSITGGLNVSGISTLGRLKVFNDGTGGIVTATSGIITYYGDGQFLQNIVSGVGIATTNPSTGYSDIVGYGVTVITFAGPGVSTIFPPTFDASSGIATIYFQGGGSSVGETTIVKEEFTVTSATQSLFTLAAAYPVGYLDVYLNGVKLASSDFTASDGSTVTLTNAAVNGDIVEFVNFNKRDIADINEKFETSTLSVGIHTFTSVGIGTSIKQSFFDVYGNMYVRAGLSTIETLTVVNSLDVNGTDHDINGAIALDYVTVSGIVTATAFVDDGTDLLTEINTKTSTGKAIAMAMVFG
jgi:hypothetical protein